jgi:predicted nuclease of predicted toxin-antitoxin system
MNWKPISTLAKDEASRFDEKFRKRAKLLIDENIDKLAQILRDLGWNARSAQDLGLEQHDDGDLYGRAWRDKRILITSDADFLDDRKYPFHRCPTVIVVPSPSGSMDSFADAIGSTLPVIGRYSRAFRQQKIAISSDGSWLVRGFSKRPGVHWSARFRIDRQGKIWEWQDDNIAQQRPHPGRTARPRRI